MLPIKMLSGPMRYSRLLTAVSLVFAASVAGRAQDLGLTRGGNADMIQRGPGLQVYGLSIFGTGQIVQYQSTTAAPISSPSALTNKEWRGQGGVSGSLGWQKAWKSSSFSLGYAGSYANQFTAPHVPQTTHNANLDYSLSAKITPRLTYSFGLGSIFQNFESYLLGPGTLSVSLPSGADFNSLVSSLQSGVLTPTEFANLTAGATVQDVRANPVLYGRRVLTSNVRNTLTFAKSSRTNYYANVTVGRADFFGNSNASLVQTPTGAVTTINYFSHTLSGGAGVGMNYAITPRTTLGIDINGNRFFSRVSDAYYVNGLVNLGHVFTPWWYGQIRGGVGNYLPVSGNRPIQFDPQVIGGGSMGVQGFSQTLAFDISVNATDPYAIGASRNVYGSLNWGFHRLRSRWSVFANAGERFTETQQSTFNTYRASVGMTEVLTDNLFFSLSASYASFNGNLLNLLGASTDSGVGVGNNGYRGATATLTWSPKRLIW